MESGQTERSPNPKPPSKEETEDWALGLLIDHLQRAGSSVTLIGRPDAATSSRRAPDYELSVEGRLVAVEVTRLDLSGHDLAVGDAFSKALESAVAADVAERGRGLTVVHLYVRDTPPRRELEQLARDIAPEILAAIDDMDVGDSRELRRGNASIELWLREGETRLFITRGARSMGGATAGMAAEKLVRDKATQASNYEVVWILAIDMMVIADADEFAEAMLSIPDRPPNWERLYLLPATDRRNVVEIDLRQGAGR